MGDGATEMSGGGGSGGGAGGDDFSRAPVHVTSRAESANALFDRDAIRSAALAAEGGRGRRSDAAQNEQALRSAAGRRRSDAFDPSALRDREGKPLLRSQRAADVLAADPEARRNTRADNDFTPEGDEDDDGSPPDESLTLADLDEAEELDEDEGRGDELPAEKLTELVEKHPVVAKLREDQTRLVNAYRDLERRTEASFDREVELEGDLEEAVLEIEYLVDSLVKSGFKVDPNQARVRELERQQRIAQRTATNAEKREARKREAAEAAAKQKSRAEFTAIANAHKVDLHDFAIEVRAAFDRARLRGEAPPALDAIAKRLSGSKPGKRQPPPPSASPLKVNGRGGRAGAYPNTREGIRQRAIDRGKASQRR